jgi:hypothetical protein
MSRNYESSGPDVKIRGTAMHIAEKYSSLARDAMSSGDTVAAENYLQHAEHYNRIILAAQIAGLTMDGQPSLNGGRFGQPDSFQRDYDGDDDGDGDGDDYMPQQRQPLPLPPQRPVPERAAYNPNQPQPYIPQNAFPQIQPQPIAPANGAPGVGGEPFPAPQDGDRLPRRRRRRPIGEPPLKGLNGRSGNGAPEPAGSSSPAPGDDSKPDEPAS